MSQGKRNPSRLLFHRPPAKRDEARLHDAREKANEYRQGDDRHDHARRDVPTMDEWNNLVSQRIEEAMRRGEFDNLSGRGKPIQVQREPFVPEDQQMAFKLLQNNDLTPDWIAERKEMLRLKQQFRDQVQQIAHEALAQWHAADDVVRRQEVLSTWERWLARWENEIREINRRIQNLNLKQPVAHLEVIKLRLEDELHHAGVRRSLAES
jgi:DnaJ family protein C protein 28